MWVEWQIKKNKLLFLENVKNPALAPLHAVDNALVTAPELCIKALVKYAREHQICPPPPHLHISFKRKSFVLKVT